MDKKDKNEVIDKNYLESFVEKKITEAKLVVAEKRLVYLLWLLVIFGAIVPFILSITSTEKVDKAVEEMKSNFKELAGQQLMKPDLNCYYEGENINGSVVTIDYKTPYYRNITFRNEGDGKAKNIRIYLYIKENDKFNLKHGLGGWWYESTINDEKYYSKCYYNEIFFDRTVEINPKESLSLELKFPDLEKQTEEALIPMMFKLFYEQPEPKKIEFSLRLIKKN